MLQYRSGSVIYFQGDAADKIYIVQSGSVRVTYQNIETGGDEQDILQAGECFGVKSALGRYNREENAVTVQDSMIMAMSVNEFERFAMTNTRIIMKILKVFSNQLRRIHRQVTSLMVKEELPGPEDGLFRVGAYYLKNKRYAQARYVFSRYLTYYPGGDKSTEATQGLTTAENALAEGDQQVSVLPSSGTGYVVGAQGSFAVGTADFTTLSGDSRGGAQKNPAGDGASAADVPPQTEAAGNYAQAADLLARGMYPQAYMALRKIVEAGTDQEYAVKSIFDIGRCLFYMGKYDNCIRHFTQIIAKHSRRPELGDALYFMGQSYEKTGQKDQAAAFYKKILSLAAGEENEIYQKAKQALEVLGV
jgi:CRP-like cAMP-binding protein